MSSDLEAAWDELHAATPPGWYVGTADHVERDSWAQYGYDTTERVKIGKRSREWTATAPTEVGVVREILTAGATHF